MTGRGCPVLLVLVLGLAPACSNGRADLTAGCSAGVDGATLVARRGSRMKEASVRAGWETTHREIEAAQGVPFQHELADMDEPLCLFIVRGKRADKPLTAAVWLSKAHLDGERNASAQFADGEAPPAWVDRLPRP